MMRARLTASTLVLALIASLPARADDIPVIATYEMKKERTDSRLAARDPKAFWIHQIVARLDRVAPTRPRGLKASAKVQLTFVVGRDGRLVSKAVQTSSGNERVDQIAVAMLVRAQPFPPMPAAMTETDMSFTLPVRFR